MAIWKVFLVFVFGCASLGLAMATIIVPLAVGPGQERWMWLGGLLFGTLCMGTLFALFLRYADRSYNAR